MVERTLEQGRDQTVAPPLRPRVKICGITRVADALAAAQAGADAIGLVFYQKSPRAVSAKTAARIQAALPPFVTTVGLFVNASTEEVARTLEQVPLDLLQFHGDEPAAFCEQFARPYIKAVRMQAQTDLCALAKAYPKSRGLLLDTYVKGLPGGTGERFNWQWVTPDALSALDKPIILAGGLNDNNVSRAIGTVQPWAVDVSGGVESAPGQKDAQAMQAFVQAATDSKNRNDYDH
ncbi:MAG: phosphoribosylanthranilate isomerase [Hydrogenovibrio sp.]|uniref:phosphoribosylanthranilate isomerase n=1 Tax=Hydrogenovibrio TaxID=28884 RepID=UPI000375CDE6|nr:MULTISPECIES: phosphoribosylanthranilate isomerase [Hydrogenovibrio]MDR9499601.1 phosphoribosylanthranilate isomerase [Hydrogenovibrio sp.]